MPDVASAGTIHAADTAQLPQSTSPVVVILPKAVRLGLRESVALGWIVVTRRAPTPPYQPIR